MTRAKRQETTPTWKVIAVLPAYNAEATLERTIRDIPDGCVDEMLLVDDGSTDGTVELASGLGLEVRVHERNEGYGANQKTCYRTALERGADVIVMIHPDYQYDARIIPFAIGFIQSDICDVVLGSRIRTRREVLDGGMPLYKYISNRMLTIIENVVLGQNLGDFHSGFRMYRREVLEKINFLDNSDDFVFDSELLAQAAWFGFRIGDVPIPTRYFAEASSISFARSAKYGLQTLWLMAKYLLQRMGIAHFDVFRSNADRGSDGPGQRAGVCPPDPHAE